MYCFTRIPLGQGASLLLAAALTMASAAISSPTQAQPIPLRSDDWQAEGEVSFSRDPDYPQGLMTVKGGGAVLKDVDFSDGTIEYDIKESAGNQGIAGIWFRQQGRDSAENVYLRIDAGCPASVECVQYAPVSHGNVEWDVYPEFQAPAPVKSSGWNHVKLVISGQRMKVYLNRELQPSLSVARLAGDAPSGQLQLRGDAMFANLDVTPGAVEGLAPQALLTEADTDPRYVRLWTLAPVASLARGQQVHYADKPPASAAWQPIAAESKGFVNIGRRHGTASGVPDLAWLSSTIRSEGGQSKHVALGWARQVWVYVNGKQVYADRNSYYPASGRKPPLGRMALDNGGFELPLAAGENRIDIAISNDLGSKRHWGWGFEFRLDDLDGVIMPVSGAALTAPAP